MDRPLRWHDYITINANYFALTVRSQVLLALLIPLLVQQYVGEAVKGSYVGQLRLWSLMAALLFQALFGLLSDRSTSSLGRRRPFILSGTLLESLIFIGIGFAAGLSGLSGYWIFFTLIVLSGLASNIGHAATQALIPDLVPDEKKGFFSGIKALFEVPFPLIFVSFVLADIVAAGNLWGAILISIAVLLISMAVTMFVPEKPIHSAVPINWKPFARLVLMTAIFTSVILSMGRVVSVVISAGWDSNSLLVTGFFAIGISVLIGVWLSARVGLGKAIQQHSSFIWWIISRLTFMLGATNLAGFMVFFLQERFPKYQGEAAAAPAGQIAMFVGVFILLASVPGGWLADRFGKKPLVVMAGLVSGGGTFLLVTAPSLTVIYIAACIIGVGIGFFYSASWALGTKLAPAESAGYFMGVSNLGGAGSGAIGAYIGGPLADATSFTLLLTLYGIIMLFSILTLLGIKEK